MELLSSTYMMHAAEKSVRTLHGHYVQPTHKLVNRGKPSSVDQPAPNTRRLFINMYVRNTFSIHWARCNIRRLVGVNESPREVGEVYCIEHCRRLWTDIQNPQTLGQCNSMD